MVSYPASLQFSRDSRKDTHDRPTQRQESWHCKAKDKRHGQTDDTDNAGLCRISVCNREGHRQKRENGETRNNRPGKDVDDGPRPAAGEQVRLQVRLRQEARLRHLPARAQQALPALQPEQRALRRLHRGRMREARQAALRVQRLRGTPKVRFDQAHLQGRRSPEGLRIEALRIAQRREHDRGGDRQIRQAAAGAYGQGAIPACDHGQQPRPLHHLRKDALRLHQQRHPHDKARRPSSRLLHKAAQRRQACRGEGGQVLPFRQNPRPVPEAHRGGSPAP